MKTILIMGFILIVAVVSVSKHEQDLYRNCREYGNARAWFVDITCEEMKR